MSGFQFLSGLLFLVEFLEFLLCSEISCFGFPKLFGIFRVALLFICQGALLTAYPSRLPTFFRSFSVGSLFSLTTLIGYHMFFILSTTFFHFFHFLFWLLSKSILSAPADRMDFHYSTSISVLSMLFFNNLQFLVTIHS